MHSALRMFLSPPFYFFAQILRLNARVRHPETPIHILRTWLDYNKYIFLYVFSVVSQLDI